MDLFDDLPEPGQTSSLVSAPTPNTKGGREEKERRIKRRREDEEEQQEVKEVKEAMKKVCKEDLPVLRGHVSVRRGEREEMQDAHVLVPDFHGCLSSPPSHVSRVAYFAVFDGHGGSRASQYAAEHLHLVLAKKFPTGDVENLDRLIKKCLLDTFRQTDEEFLRKASSQKPVWKDGSTATCLLAVDDVVYVANLGDSRAVLCRSELEEDGRRKFLTLALSKEHNPTIYEERMRIQRAGGTVRDGRVLGVLEVSRSIGDGQYKRCGVISTPDLRRCQLSANDRFILLACDGLFKVFSAEEAVHYVLTVLQPQEGAVDPCPKEEEAQRFDSACQQLASEAVKRGCADNVTVILISIGFCGDASS